MGGKRALDVDTVGKVFGKLTILKRYGVDKRNHTLWECLCECGKHTLSELLPLKSGLKKSCGCLKTTSKRSVIHGACSRDATPEMRSTFESWVGARKRCTNPNNRAFKWYGARGIRVADEWGNFDSFLNDMGTCPDKHSLERVDVNKGYEPGNCVWIPIRHQARNRRTTLRVEYQGAEWCLKTLCSHLNITYMKVYKRYRIRGWSLERSLSS